MKESGGDARSYAGFLREWEPLDLGFAGVVVPIAGTNGLAFDSQPFGAFCAFVNTTGSVQLFAVSGDLDQQTVYATLQVGAATGGAGKFAFPFGIGAPNLAGVLFRGMLIRVVAVGAPATVTVTLLGRV